MQHQWPLQATVQIRKCRAGDLENLEWYGMFTPHREIIRNAYDRQCEGTNLMLIAEMNGFPIGQVWVDFERRADSDAGYVWALRVYPIFQGMGIGRRLLEAAEAAIRARDCAAVELAVETDNQSAIGFYKHLGYRPAGTQVEDYTYTTPDGEMHSVYSEQLVYRKPLHGHIPAKKRVRRRALA
jgi:ribosomal protein S18 acetylase RimI-like enzyme